MAAPCVSIVTRRSKRILPRERSEATNFTAADKAKLDSIPWGGGGGGGIEVDWNNVPVTMGETVVNFTGDNVTNVVDEGFQTTVTVETGDIDGGVF